MEEQRLQLHLASKISLPPELDEKGKPKEGAQPRSLAIPGMSNRVVRFRVLSADALHRISNEAATIAGKEATGRELYLLSRQHYLYSMVYEVSEPTDDPSKLDHKKDWKRVTSVDLMTPGGALSWSTLFTAKDTAVLESEYAKYHEIPIFQIEMLSGKAIPVASGV